MKRNITRPNLYIKTCMAVDLALIDGAMDMQSMCDLNSKNDKFRFQEWLSLEGVNNLCFNEHMKVEISEMCTWRSRRVLGFWSVLMHCSWRVSSMQLSIGNRCWEMQGAKQLWLLFLVFRMARSRNSLFEFGWRNIKIFCVRVCFGGGDQGCSITF